MSDVHNATLRALRAANPGSPRIMKMNSAPTSGKKMINESSGQSPIV